MRRLKLNYTQSHPSAHVVCSLLHSMEFFLFFRCILYLRLSLPWYQLKVDLERIRKRTRREREAKNNQLSERIKNNKTCKIQWKTVLNGFFLWCWSSHIRNWIYIFSSNRIWNSIHFRALYYLAFGTFMLNGRVLNSTNVQISISATFLKNEIANKINK